MTLPLDVNFQVPQLTNHGFLPPGIYDCTLPELKFKFANLSQKRLELYVLFETFLSGLMEHMECIEEVYVDGQFVSNLEETSDIDVLIVAKTLSDELTIEPFIDRMNRVAVDIKVAAKDTPLCDSWFSLYKLFNSHKHSEHSGKEKGFLRMVL